MVITVYSWSLAHLVKGSGRRLIKYMDDYRHTDATRLSSNSRYCYVSSIYTDLFSLTVSVTVSLAVNYTRIPLLQFLHAISLYAS